VPENPYLFLKSLYIDKRSGLNVRNDLAHGLVEVRAFSEETARVLLIRVPLLGVSLLAQCLVLLVASA
jgi:hypothetical protein